MYIKEEHASKLEAPFYKLTELDGRIGKFNKLSDIVMRDLLWSVAVLFYLLFVSGVLVFVVLPGLHVGSAKTSAPAWGYVWLDVIAAIVSYVGFLTGKFLS